MPFVTLPFFIFVLAVVLVYFLVPKDYRWTVLLIASYIYFWTCSGALLGVHVLATVITFVTGRAIGKVYDAGDERLAEIQAQGLSPAELKQAKKANKAEHRKKAQRVMVIGIILVFAILIFMKYYNLISITANVAHLNLPTLNLLIPIGISFYTLQAIGYMVDVFRRKYKPDNNILKFALFMSFFPQIVQGPFARYSHLAEQLYEGHDFSYDRAMKGAQLMLWGILKKLIIADRIAIPVIYFFENYEQYHGLMIFIGLAMYGLQMYADFSGGIDIARGVSQIFGIELEMNFLQPYFSTSVEDFWRRWHVSLGAWMRDYIFYPLSLSKAFGALGRVSRNVIGQFAGKRLPAFLAMYIVYFLVGMWHGPNSKYAFYGLWNGTFIAVGILMADRYESTRNKLGIKSESWSWKIFQMIRTFVIISIGRSFDGADNLSHALGILRNLPKRWWDLSCLVDGTFGKMGLDTANWLILLFSIIGLLYVDVLHEKGVKIRDTIGRQNIIFRWLIFYAAIIAVIIFGMWGPAYDSASFIYEQF